MSIGGDMKLNLGCGQNKLEGYINMDALDGLSIYPLEYKGCVDEIRASHVLEHFGHEESVQVLLNWVDCLVPGGVIKIAVPDFDDLIRRYQAGEPLNYECILFGGQTDKYDYHKSLWSCNKLRFIMESIGLYGIRTWQSEIADCASYNFSLNLMGYKK
jgi:predicted SAM-dependent methyltransferase